MRTKLILVSFLLAYLSIPLVAAQESESMTGGMNPETTPTLIAVGIIGLIAGAYIILSAGRLPRGQITIKGPFEILLITGAMFIAAGEVALVVDSLGIAESFPFPTPLHVIHDVLMAISLVFLAFAIRELIKLRKGTVGTEG